MKPRQYLTLSISLLTAVSMVGFQSANGASKETYAHKMEIGQLLFFNGDIDRAIKAFLRASDLKPTAFEPHLNLVNLYVQKGGDEALSNAAAECGEVLKLKPANKEIHLILGNLIRTQASSITDKDKMNAKLEEALKEVQTAQDMGAPEALCENTIGLTLLQKGDMDGALLHIDKALKKQSNFPDAHLVRAVLLFKGATKDAKPGEPAGTLDSPEKKKKLEEVFAELDLAIKQKEKNPEAHNTKADILFAAGRHDEALDHYHQATEHEPRYAQAWAGIGNAEAHLASNETDSDKKRVHINNAKDAYDKAKRIKPSDKNIVYGLAVMLEKQGAVSDAIQEFQNGLLLETDPMMKAQITMHMQQLQRAGLGGSHQIGVPGMNGNEPSVGENMFINGALSVPFSSLIKVKQPPKEKEQQ